MLYEMAPMEGITNYLYRRIHRELFGGVDKYFTPFISPNANLTFTTKEQNEIDPSHNEGLWVVPQILANQAGYFCWAMEELRGRGYREVNFNLGCPSGTVTAKGKGAGFLSEPEKLDAFLDAVFSRAGDMKISIKTR
ncbi:MAG: diguanylate cyclase, partial [Clostridiales bacterium]|nr:diguanylate cyclase [Clostridiales bacterium]